ncbi:hypothetical protein HPB50_019676 [Hyalomma asiaticum]|uniref:Uncharacterized protein n=1 Tax=Hyalomma asiaticum TaxID=266040 RepID=A0ACB7SHJ1_HYAAI|nr:hypothetical protein HPB50_019676 [Hyalomma asiaticum]
MQNLNSSGKNTVYREDTSDDPGQALACLDTFIRVMESRAVRCSFCSSRRSARRTLSVTGTMDVRCIGEGPFLGDPIVGVLKVDYGNGASVVINGSLTPSQTASAPKSVALIGASKCVPPFALVMVDPDAPSRNGATQRSWLHWMVINARSTTELHKGEQLVPYEGPSPPPGTGPHRYVFLAYCQGGQAVNGAKLKPARRNKFSVKDFQKKLGESRPFAGTFFYADSATN